MPPRIKQHPKTLAREMHSLDPDAWNAEQVTDWTFSLTGGKLRATYAGNPTAVDWNYNGGVQVETGAILVGRELTQGMAVSLNGVSHALAVAMDHDQPSVNGIGVGVGIINASTFAAATEWMAVVNERDGATTLTIRDESDAAEFSVGAAVAQADYNRVSFSGSIIDGLWQIVRRGSDDDVIGQKNNRFAAFVDLDGQRWWLALFFVSTAGADGTVDVTRAASIGQRAGLFT